MPLFAITGPSPTSDPHLKERDAVNVRNKGDIAATASNSRNRGLWFNREMVLCAAGGGGALSANTFAPSSG